MPEIESLAEIIFSIPASEIECERIFSNCGILTIARRNRLSFEISDDLVQVNQNFPDDSMYSTHVELNFNNYESEELLLSLYEDLYHSFVENE